MNTENELSRILRALKRTEKEVLYVCHSGSVVYGTNTPSSDTDYTVVLTNGTSARDLVKTSEADLVVYTKDSFAESLRTQKLFAIEAFFAPEKHRVKEAKPPFAYKLIPATLVESSLERASSDYEKSLRRWDEDPESAQKRLFHALRTLLFTQQLLREKCLTEFSSANSYLQQLKRCASAQEAEALVGTVYRTLVETVQARAR